MPDTTLKKTREGLYKTTSPVQEHVILDAAREILLERVKKEGPVFHQASTVADFVFTALAGEEREVFAVLFLDAQNRLLAFERMFYGSINQSPVFPREILKRALALNSAAVIVAHNHPSGLAVPSSADKSITGLITDALAVCDIRLLDHFIVGESVYSFAEHGDL